jgi:putative endopeptidase
MMRSTARSLAFATAFLTSALTASAQIVHQQTKPIDPANIDRTANACVDFYQFANGGWIKNNPIPPAFSLWGSFNELTENNNSALTKILTKAANDANAKQSAATKMLGDFYASCMDSAAAEKAGASPLRPRLARIDAITNQAGLQREIARLRSEGVTAAFNFGSTQDSKNSTSVIGGAGQGGLGLPDRDYYTKTDSGSAVIRANYVAHMRKMFQLAGETEDQAEADSKRVMALETALAAASLTRVEQRDPIKTYNYRTPAQLASMTPHFSWTQFFTDLGVPNIPAVDVQSPKYFAAVDSLMANVPLSDWKAYLRWKVIRAAAPFLSSAFVNENFNFSRTLSGARELLSRDKRCTRLTDTGLRDALGQAYVAEYFTPQAKARALEMVHNLEAVFRERLAKLPWMSETTRQQALVKLQAFAEKIGYPDKWRDYSTLTIKRGSLLDNVLAVNQYENRRDLGMIGKPLDRTRWGMTPPTVNAYYNPQMNEIVFPAGILQPPFFSPTADDAVNYGGMGSVIGHEMGHGFDDQGAQYDPQGNLKNWWSAEDLEKFKTRTGMIASQYDAYTVLDSVHVNGKLTLGENAADIGGLAVAYAAMEKALAGKPKPLIDGVTPEQRFFLAWAQFWRQNVTPQQQQVLINIDPHSPGRWRVNGPLSNMVEFAEAFGCKAGDPMVRPEAQRATLW